MRTLLFVMLGLSSLTGSASTPNLKEFVYIADVIGIWEPDQYQLNKKHPGKAKQFLKGNQDILAGLQIKDSHLNTMDKYRKTGKPLLFMFLILDKEIHLVHALEENEKNIQKVKRLIEIGRLENSWETLEIDAQIKKADVIITGDITYVKQKFPRTYYVNAKAEHKGSIGKRNDIFSPQGKQEKNLLIFLCKNPGNGPAFIVVGLIPMKKSKPYLEKLTPANK